MPKGVYPHKSTYQRTTKHRALARENFYKRIAKGEKFGGNMLGKKHTKEAKEKMRQAKLKNPTRYWLDKKLPLDHNRKLQKGKSKLKFPPNWRGGITPINEKIRKSIEYKLWRKSVFERDDYTCVWCGQKGGKLNADHIKPFAYFPELRFAIDNGRTLCIDCHKKTDTYGKGVYKYKL